jgi:hypothetical protein
MPPRVSVRAAHRRHNPANRYALIAFLFAVGFLILLGVGLWMYREIERGQLAGRKRNGDGAGDAAPAAPFGLPGLPNPNPLAPPGEVLWPKLQGRWVKAGEQDQPAAGFVEFTPDRRYRVGAPWATVRKADGRESPYLQDDPITRVESTGVNGKFRIWLKLDFIQHEGYQNFKLVGDVLYREVVGPGVRNTQTEAYVKVR